MQKEQQAAPMELELFTYLFSKIVGSSGARKDLTQITNS